MSLFHVGFGYWLGKKPARVADLLRLIVSWSVIGFAVVFLLAMCGDPGAIAD